ncbi:Plasmodium variant antigen protein Cir/Yir/Bir, putative [Plasmodium chabaudi adami]|uniref:Plasmodium variant antigen protein Cir/Yir/Bir, putative n=1 Tax=Plasmodium chabaudi adami TaxID=5826 RepID=A0A1C6W9K7_PLACE|nr:Plasmodium variant antigen protein Cir/Yir/Bir, putative [Plasmodium chabaudi adami]
MSEELCEGIKFADENVVFDPKSQKYTFKNKIFDAYCPAKENGVKGECDSNGLKVGSAFTALIEYFKSIDNENSEDDKLTQYAILWFNSIIMQNKNIEIAKDTIYGMIKQNDWFSEYSESIDGKKDITEIHYLYLKHLYDFLKGICETVNKCKDSSNSSECIKYAEKCSGLYRACVMHLPWREICNPYCNVLTNLKNDYDKLKAEYSLPELKLPEGLYDCKVECFKQEERYKARIAALTRSSDGSKIGTTPGISLLDLSVTPTSINNGNKLPYIAIPLILIPIILGISYKYLTHGRRKKLNAKKKVKAIINLSDQKKA